MQRMKFFLETKGGEGNERNTRSYGVGGNSITRISNPQLELKHGPVPLICNENVIFGA